MKFLALMPIMFMFGCTTTQTVTCPLEQSFNVSIATELNTLAACSNSTAIETQLSTWEVPLKLCPASSKPQGIVSDICVSLIPLVESAANNVNYLSQWGCDLTKASSVTALLTQACNLIPAQIKHSVKK